MRLFLMSFGLVFLFTGCSGDKSHLQREQAVLANYPEATAEMTLVQVSEHSYYVQGAAGVATDNQGFISNAGAIVTNDGVVIFDALGTPALASKMIRLLREVTEQPIKRVIMSHYHADHIYGLQLYKEI
ncbi:MAG: MBL fold metallo-hydrolase, partial [Gammaproteobacteria bacterium]|nr:MBL fold metallo-hydrolase [Gammaproteobacteria bacterium]